MNMRKRFDRAETGIIVPDVQPLDPLRASFRKIRPDVMETAGPLGAATPNVSRIEIDKPARALRAYDSEVRLTGFYPATIGNTDKPARSGTFEVRSVAYNPTCRYDPE